MFVSVSSRYTSEEVPGTWQLSWGGLGAPVVALTRCSSGTAAVSGVASDYCQWRVGVCGQGLTLIKGCVLLQAVPVLVALLQHKRGSSHYVDSLSAARCQASGHCTTARCTTLRAMYVAVITGWHPAAMHQRGVTVLGTGRKQAGIVVLLHVDACRLRAVGRNFGFKQRHAWHVCPASAISLRLSSTCDLWQLL